MRQAFFRGSWFVANSGLWASPTNHEPLTIMHKAHYCPLIIYSKCSLRKENSYFITIYYIYYDLFSCYFRNLYYK